MVKLWGRLSSINVQKVVWVLDELGVAFQRAEAGGAFGVVDTPEYRALNPNGLVPTIDIDGFVLWESNAIVRHLAATHAAGGLWPADPRTRADADRWMDWQTTAATPALRDAFWGLVRAKPEARDEAAIGRSLEASARAAILLDGHLAGRPFVAGERFSTGDIAVGCHAHRWLNMAIARPDLPHLAAWYARLRERPGAQGVLALPVT